MKRILLSIVFLLFALATRADSVLSGTAISGNNWSGWDLGAPYLITVIGWTPITATSTQLGIIEGANRADFMDAIPLMMIEYNSAAGQMQYQQIDCSRGVRYVRFVSPEGHSSQPALELWGESGIGDDTRLPRVTNLPSVVIHTQDNVIPYDKEHEINCFITVLSDNEVLSDTATIRERGNASRGFPKKPYRIKFAHKHNVLGAPAKAKKWTLINNYGDKTLMRNQLAFELSRRFGMPYTPFCTYVDVILNGDYKGCYQLCDQVEVHKNRVAITEMKTTDNSGQALTGGYFIEADAYAGSEPSMFWSNFGTGVTVKSPKEDSITSQQLDYIRTHYNKMENNWRSYLDLNTFLRHFLVGELSGNTDTYWSLYLYKQRANDTLFVGPCWDFDLAFENDDRTYPISQLTDYIYRTNGSTTGYLRTLVDKIVINDNSAKNRMLAIWSQARKAGLTEDNLVAYVDEQAERLQHSQRLNFLRWPIMKQRVHQNPRIWGSYEKEVENIRHYIRYRIPWMDDKIGFDVRTLDTECVPFEPIESRKVLQNGQLFIERNGRKYTLTGLEIQ